MLEFGLPMAIWLFVSATNWLGCLVTTIVIHPPHSHHVAIAIPCQVPAWISRRCLRRAQSAKIQLGVGPLVSGLRKVKKPYRLLPLLLWSCPTWRSLKNGFSNQLIDKECSTTHGSITGTIVRYVCSAKAFYLRWEKLWRLFGGLPEKQGPSFGL